MWASCTSSTIPSRCVPASWSVLVALSDIAQQLTTLGFILLSNVACGPLTADLDVLQGDHPTWGTDPLGPNT
jgi:hypothetical protein